MPPRHQHHRTGVFTPGRPIGSFVCVGVGLLVCLAGPVRSAQAQGEVQPGPMPPTQPVREVSSEDAEREVARLKREWTDAFEKKRFADAEQLLRALIPYEHENFVHWYNLSCVISRQAEQESDQQRRSLRADEAVRMLEQSIARGFGNRVQMQNDPDLAAARETQRYRAVLGRWSASIAEQSARRIERLKTQYQAGEQGSGYVFERDERHGLAIISGFEPRLLASVRQEFDRLADWWRSDVSPDPPSTQSADARKFDGPVVAVVLPTRADYRAWARGRFGDLSDRVGGIYAHDERLLVAMDLGATLRHEFWHVLHWRDMEARGQHHPIWLQEGLCSLVEDVIPGHDGSMVVKPSWRTNMVRRMADRGLLTPWDALLGMKQDRFVRTRPLAMYAQGRALCMWLHERGKLRVWYAAYAAGYADDQTGKAAFERVFNQPIAKVEREFRQWARTLPLVQEELGRGRANLPVELDPGVGDGVVVAQSDLGELLRAGRRAGEPARSDLRAGDVISAINGQAVRDVNDLTRILGEFDPGREVELDVRRHKRSLKVRVTLVPPHP